MRGTAAGLALPAWTRGWPGSRRMLAVLAGLGATILAAGCSGGGAAGGPVSGTVTVAAVPGIDNTPLDLALSQGMFTSAGLTVRIVKYPTVDAELKALNNGQVDIAAGDYGPFLFQASQQKTANLRVISDGYDATSGVLEVLTLPSSKITSPGQLSGKRIAAPSSAALSTPPGTPDSLDTAATTSVLRSYGVDMATVTWKVMPQSQEISALREGLVQAILVTEPYLYEAESELGATELLDACSGATAGLPLSGYFTTSTWANSEPDAIADFRAAMGRAQTSAAMAGPVQTSLPGYTGMSKLDAEVVTVGSYPASTNVSDLQRVSQLMSDEGMLSNPVEIAKLMAR